jgi:hypothetical protein
MHHLESCRTGIFSGDHFTQDHARCGARHRSPARGDRRGHGRTGSKPPAERPPIRSRRPAPRPMRSGNATGARNRANAEPWHRFKSCRRIGRSVSPTGTTADVDPGTPPEAGKGQPPSMAAQVQWLPTGLPAIGGRGPRPMRGTPPEPMTPQLRLVLTIGTKGCRFLILLCSPSGIFSGDHFTPPRDERRTPRRERKPHGIAWRPNSLAPSHTTARGANRRAALSCGRIANESHIIDVE